MEYMQVRNMVGHLCRVEFIIILSAILEEEVLTTQQVGILRNYK